MRRVALASTVGRGSSGCAKSLAISGLRNSSHASDAETGYPGTPMNGRAAGRPSPAGPSTIPRIVGLPGLMATP